MAQSALALIVGLGNPGDRYAASRHNVGFRFIELLQDKWNFRLVNEKKFNAKVACIDLAGRAVRLMIPNTFMNLSGQSLAPLAAFYRILPPQILVIHDELDLAVGDVRIKIGGGHGGHNGVRDIISRLGHADFVRLRIGIGHPGANRDVTAYVLHNPENSELVAIETAMQRALEVFDSLLAGDFATATQHLHSPTS